MATARKLPSGNYRIRVYDKKTGKCVSFTAETKKKAEKLAADFQVGAAIKASCVTIRDRAEEYISLRSNKLSPATIDKYRESLDNQLSADFLSLRMDQLTDKDIVAEVNRLAGHYAPKTIKNTMAFILPIIRDERPDLGKHIDLPKVQKQMKEYPRASEIIKVFRGDWIELEVLLALCLGLRKEEIRGLKPADLSENGILTINRVKITINKQDIVKEEAKTVESRRRIALPPFLRELYRQRSGEWILPGSGHSLYMHYRRMMDKAGFKGITFHDLRHINASEMLALKVPDKYAMERGGWSTDNILKSVYQATFSEERQHYDELINSHFSKMFATRLDTNNKKLAQIRYFKRLK
jgi:integrase